MRTTLGWLALALALMLGFAAGAPARAEDGAQPLSAAEQAYKDAWWAETGGGDLNAALALYEKAAAEEGPAGVRAKALYRRALIQQRIGKTQDAIQTLERLAKEHPGEAEVQSDARARLAEWTAVDLRTGFPEWYRRFQYGPEFQAKILDLVLKLGGAGDEVRAARQELLTIGEPAIPALRAHLGTRNSGLAVQVVDTLMQLGVVPDEAVASHGMWTMSEPSWGLIFDLPQERRAGLRVRMGTAPDSDHAQALAAALEGPAVCVEFLARLAPPPPGQAYPTWRWRFRGACLARVDAGGPLGERVRALVGAGVPDPQVWQGLARWLIEKRLVARADLDAWARLPWETAASVRVQALRDSKLFTPSEALQVLSEVISARPAITGPGQHGWLFDALTLLLPDLPWPESRDEVARVLGPLWFDLNRWGAHHVRPSDRLLEAFGRAFELAREPNLLQYCGDAWMQHGPGRPGGTETLFRWAREGALPAHRTKARAALFPLLAGRDLDAAVDLLVTPEAVDDDLAYAWKQLLADSPQSGAILGNPVRLWRLLDRIAAVPAAEQKRARQLAIYLVSPIERDQASVNTLLDPWLSHAERFPPVVFFNDAGELRKSVTKAGQLPALRRAFRQRWATASPEQRAGLLAGLGVLDVPADPELQAFLRGELAAQPRRVPAVWRHSVIARLTELSVADIRAFYDLTQPEQADEAAGWVLRQGHAPILTATPEAFEALRVAFRPDGPHAEELALYFERLEELQRPLMEVLLAHSETNTRYKGLLLLIKRSSPDDAGLWVLALKDPKAIVRTEAAKSASRVPTPSTLKALVAALDDPHPDVRAAALESLDAIQKMEDLKARWREKVK